jgi:hypothetical protein
MSLPRFLPTLTREYAYRLAATMGVVAALGLLLWWLA